MNTNKLQYEDLEGASTPSDIWKERESRRERHLKQENSMEEVLKDYNEMVDQTARLKILLYYSRNRIEETNLPQLVGIVIQTLLRELYPHQSLSSLNDHQQNRFFNFLLLRMIEFYDGYATCPASSSRIPSNPLDVVNAGDYHEQGYCTHRVVPSPDTDPPLYTRKCQPDKTVDDDEVDIVEASVDDGVNEDGEDKQTDNDEGQGIADDSTSHAPHSPINKTLLVPTQTLLHQGVTGVSNLTGEVGSDEGSINGKHDQNYLAVDRNNEIADVDESTNKKKRKRSIPEKQGSAIPPRVKPSIPCTFETCDKVFTEESSMRRHRSIKHKGPLPYLPTCSKNTH